MREPKRGRLAAARVYVDGKPMKVVRGKRLRARVNLRGLPKGRYKVRVAAITSTGRSRTCSPARGKSRIRS